ncbi:hypothetical protein H4R24_004433 [Coemansia sp. RSA 988]|nr:hypothetical protein H4R24_004433 [Coemansia sp. RSA 988]
MVLTNGAVHKGEQSASKSAETILAEIRERLAEYEELEQESTRLAQEQRTLENYVKNLMDSNVFTYRAQRSVNYYEETYGPSEESDFQLSEAEESPKKKRVKTQSTSKAVDKRPASKTAGKPRTISIPNKADGDNEKRLEKEDTLLIELDPVETDKRKPTNSNYVSDSRDDTRRTVNGDHSTVSDDESDMYKDGHDSASDSDEYAGSDGNDSDVVIDVVVGRGGGKKGTTKGKSAPTVANGKDRGSKTKTTAGKGSKRDAVKAPRPTTEKVPALMSSKIATRPATAAIIHVGSAKRNVALGSLLSSPNKPYVARPKLAPTGSSTSSTSSTSLSASLVSPTRSPNGIKRKTGGASLKDLLKGSNVPRAGLTRRALPKKVI